MRQTVSKVLMRRVLQFLKDFANERKLAWQQDAVGNMVIKRTGTGGGELAPAVVIQVHSCFQHYSIV